jgi:hypothetical protein
MWLKGKTPIYTPPLLQEEGTAPIITLPTLLGQQREGKEGGTGK